MSRFVRTLSWSLFFTTAMTACGFFKAVDEALPDHRVDYKKSQTVPSLELPPNLSAETVQEQLVIPEEQTNPREASKASKVLPLSDKVQIKRVGKVRWLVIHETPETIWPKVKNFWIDSGFSLKKDSPQIGIMETNWIENRADIPQDALRKLIGKVVDNLYSASTRDKFKTRLERDEQNQVTELYLTHQGVQEVTQGDQFVWQPRPSDPELEAEMLNRLMVFLGVDEKQVTKFVEEQKTPQIDLIEKPLSLVVQEEFIQAWRRIGLALERLDMTITDRNVEKGEYVVHYTPEPEDRFFAGWFKKDNPKTYLIKVVDEKTSTRVSILNQSGQQESNEIAKEILELLQKQLASG